MQAPQLWKDVSRHNLLASNVAVQIPTLGYALCIAGPVRHSPELGMLGAVWTLDGP